MNGQSRVGTTPSRDPRSGSLFHGASGYAIIFALLVASYALCAAQRGTNPTPWAFLVVLVTVAVVFRVTGASPMVQHLAWVILSAAGLATILTALLGASGHVLDIVFSAATMIALLVAPIAIIGHQVKRRGLTLEALMAAVTAYVLDALLKLLHPVMPFVTETLWKALTGGESVVIAEWPQPSGIALDAVAAQRITDMQRLVTEVRRFRSDQGLNDRQRVPARLVGIAAADLGTQVAAISALAWLTDPADGFAPSASVEVRLSRGTVTVEVDTSGTVDVRSAALGEVRGELVGRARRVGDSRRGGRAGPRGPRRGWPRRPRRCDAPSRTRGASCTARSSPPGAGSPCRDPRAGRSTGSRSPRGSRPRGGRPRSSAPSRCPSRPSRRWPRARRGSLGQCLLRDADLGLHFGDRARRQAGRAGADR